MVEIVVFAQPPGSYSLDATYVCDSPEAAFGPMTDRLSLHLATTSC